VRHQRADVDLAVGVTTDGVEVGDAGDVDDRLEVRSQAAFRLQQQVCAAGDDAGGAAVAGQKFQRKPDRRASRSDRGWEERCG